VIQFREARCIQWKDSEMCMLTGMQECSETLSAETYRREIKQKTTMKCKEKESVGLTKALSRNTILDYKTRSSVL
jgi:hypothetical protein